MRTQTTLFEQNHENAVKDQLDILCGHLVKVLEDNHLDDTFLHIKPAAGYYSLLFESSVIVRIYRKPLAISCKKAVMLHFPDYACLVGKGKDAYTKIRLDDVLEISDHIDLITAALQAAIDSYPKEWDCCHRFEECSDAKQCTHPDKHEGIKCGYRKALANGKIYYGKNCTIKNRTATIV